MSPQTSQGLALSALATLGLVLGSTPSAAAQDILVFDNSIHVSAQTAAFNVAPATTTVASTATLGTLLASQPWDVVLVNNPTAKPADWTPLANYIANGGLAVMSHWDWDNVGYPGMPALLNAFQVVNAGTITLTPGVTLFDSGTSAIFTGLPMPNADWHSHWGDDGDVFTPVGGAIGLAHIGDPTKPTMVLGNNGRTIAAPLIDCVGDTWINTAADIKLWENMINEVISGGGAGTCTFRAGTLGLNPNGFDCVNKPNSGFTWKSTIETTPTAGVSTLSTVVVAGLSGGVTAVPLFGYELLCLPPYLLDTNLGSHSIPVPAGFAGFALSTQGARVELDAAGAVIIVLLNAQDLVLG